MIIRGCSSLEVLDNGRDGLYVDGWGENKAVTLKNINAQYNGGEGIWVDAISKITVNGARSWFNQGSSAILDSWGNPVTVISSSFMNNDYVGLWVESDGGLVIYPNIVSVGNGDDLSINEP